LSSLATISFSSTFIHI